MNYEKEGQRTSTVFLVADSGRLLCLQKEVHKKNHPTVNPFLILVTSVT